MKRLALLAVMGLVLAAACGGLETRAPSVPTGERAPAFELTDSAGDTVSLEQVIARGPAVVVFYRGHW